jgi:quercetin dioxygenase-like cupin family protein
MADRNTTTNGSRDSDSHNDSTPPTYVLIENLAELLTSDQPDSIVSRTFHKAAGWKAILFGFDAGQELSEHTSSQAVILQIIEGTAQVVVGEDKRELGVGSWLYMPPYLKHSVYAQTPMKMLLMMFSATG